MGLEYTHKDGAMLSVKVATASLAEDGTILPTVGVDASKKGAVVAAAAATLVTEGGAIAVVGVV